MPVHVTLVDYGNKVITRIRHEDMELHIDVQSPENLNKTIRAQGLRIIVHRIKDPNELKGFVSESDKDLDKDDLQEISTMPRGAFHEVGYPLCRFRDKILRNIQTGYRLPRPRLARHEKITINEFNLIPKRDVKIYKTMLKDEWKKKADVYVQDAKDKKEKENERLEKSSSRGKEKETKIERRTKKLKEFLIQQKIGASFELHSLAKQVKIPVRFIKQCLDELEVDDELEFHKEKDKDEDTKTVETYIVLDKVGVKDKTKTENKPKIKQKTDEEIVLEEEGESEEELSEEEQELKDMLDDKEDAEKFEKKNKRDDFKYLKK
jgi:hypothetical protein